MAGEDTLPGAQLRAAAILSCMRGWLLCVAAALVCAACGSSGSGSAAVDTPDAGNDAEPPADGAIPVLDGGADADAPDARKDAIAPADRYCTKLAPKPKFCDDFDDGDLTN